MSTRFEKRIFMSAPHMSGQEMKYVQSAFDENWITPLGPNVTHFEKDMVHYLEDKNIFAVAMASGTAAIHIALRLLNVQVGEEIFCSSATFIATANPILYEKAVPVFIDSENDTWNICPKSLLKSIEQKKKSGKIPRILICADLFGMSADYVEIEKICNKYGITLIEDAAEALGSTYNAKKCGTYGKFGILSFNGNKIITTSGGGMLITHSKEEAEKALFLITQARDKAPYYLHSEIGFNYRLSNICAGIGIGQLEVIEQRVNARRNIFNIYKKNLASCPATFTEEKKGFYSNRWLSTLLIDQNCKTTPEQVIKKLDEHNVEARHIWKPLHTQPIFKNNEFYSVYEKPVAETIFEKGLCLPSGSSIKTEDIEKITEIVKSCF